MVKIVYDIVIFLVIIGSFVGVLGAVKDILRWLRDE